MGTKFENAFSHNSSANVIMKALAVVEEFPYRTTAEMASKINANQLTGEQLHKALSRLVKANKIHKVKARRCTITGKLATTWAPIYTVLLLLCFAFPAFANEGHSDHFDCGHVGRDCRTSVSVPEPSGAALLGLGLVAVGRFLRRR